jgi:hypothetical protein
MSNPFLAVINLLGLTPGSQGNHGSLFLVCSVAGSLYSSSFTGNPFSEVKRLLTAGGQSNGYAAVAGILTSGELRFAGN